MQPQPVSLKNRAAVKTRSFVAALAQSCSYELTLHTTLATAGLSSRSTEQRVFRAQSAMRYFQPRLFRALTGNSWTRYPHKRPIFIPALEGSKSQQRYSTLHWHIIIGNLPTNITLQSIFDTAHNIWIKHPDASANTEAQALYDSTGFANYITKEFKKFNYDCIDYGFFQAPYNAIDTLPACP